MHELRSYNNTGQPIQPANGQPQTLLVPAAQPRQSNLTLTRIADLENQLAQLRGEMQGEPQERGHPRGYGMYSPTQAQTALGDQSASAMVNSVETLFPGVERTTLVQIIENRFKLANMYRLLASKKDRAESQWTISIGGIEFEQTERDRKESEYRISGFCKACAAYCGILVKLAPHGLRGDNTTALLIYTMNLYDLLEKYTGDGVKGYHFQFYRKRVTSGKGIYQPVDWRHLEGELVASKCFAHPAPRPSWVQSQKSTLTIARRTYELPIRESLSAPSYGPPGTSTTPYYTQQEYRSSNNQFISVPPRGLLAGSGGTTQTTQGCRNWNYRECRAVQCGFQHQCITCDSDHKGSQCPSGNNIPPPLPHQLPRTLEPPPS